MQCRSNCGARSFDRLLIDVVSSRNTFFDSWPLWFLVLGFLRGMGDTLQRIDALAMGLHWLISPFDNPSIRC
jgi:hypothetical protein